MNPVFQTKTELTMMELELIHFEQQLPQQKSLQGKKMEDFGSN